MLSESACSNTTTVTELALEVQRLKQLVATSEAQQCHAEANTTASTDDGYA